MAEPRFELRLSITVPTVTSSCLGNCEKLKKCSVSWFQRLTRSLLGREVGRQFICQGPGPHPMVLQSDFPGVVWWVMRRGEGPGALALGLLVSLGVCTHPEGTWRTRRRQWEERVGPLGNGLGLGDWVLAGTQRDGIWTRAGRLESRESFRKWSQMEWKIPSLLVGTK